MRSIALATATLPIPGLREIAGPAAVGVGVLQIASGLSNFMRGVQQVSEAVHETSSEAAPYYQELIGRVRRRQHDQSRHLYVHVDTDGRAERVIPIYQQAIGMDRMSPFEVASGSDVVDLGRQYPELIISGGIDKRVLARTKDDIDRAVAAILPSMRRRGGYYPTCDHGVPAEVPLGNYLHYRRRCLEFGG